MGLARFSKTAATSKQCYVRGVRTSQPEGLTGFPLTKLDGLCRLVVFQH